jgi:opacity protein-like surface antigen
MSRSFLPAIQAIVGVSFLLVAPASIRAGELGLTVGTVSGPARTVSASTSTLNFSNGVALQAVYARKFMGIKYAELSWESLLMVNPRQNVTSTATSVVNHYGSLIVAPGVRIKFYPEKKLSPWAVGGGGYALYYPSSTSIAGKALAAISNTNSLALEMGGGMDWKATPKWTLRGEVRDFYTGSPNFGLAVSGRGQFNFVVSGGIVLNLGK